MAEAGHLQLRSFVEDLASLGWLREVDAPVDKDWQLACIARWAIESAGGEDAYAIRFNRIIGHEIPVVVGLFGSRRLIGRSLGISPDEIWPRWSQALADPIDPEIVLEGSVKELIRQGDNADLTSLPIPIWTPGRERSPYISSACVITVDRERRIPNAGTYRVQVQGPRRLGLFFGSPQQHGAMHLKSWEDRGEAMPVAIVVGAAPAVSYAAAAKLRYGVDEMTIAGGLLGRPVPVIRCETSELLIPAHTEIVIEGLVPPGERQDEGPFGEALGYMEGVAPAAVIDVTCITHRSSPLFHGLVQQLPPSEGHMLLEMGLLGSLWHYATRQARIEGVVDLAIVPGAAGSSMIAVSVRQGDRASVEGVVRLMTSLNWGQKVVVVVDDDIDVRDSKSVFWAISSRVDFSSDVTLQEDAPLFQRDPAAFKRVAESGPEAALSGSKVIIDATLKADCSEVSLPSRSLMMRTREEWADTGLPPLASDSRLERLLGHHSEDGVEYCLPPAPRAESSD